MNLGCIQKQIIKIGMDKGYVVLDDVRQFYTKNLQIEMNKLVLMGYFENPEDLGYTVKWKFKDNLGKFE